MLDLVLLMFLGRVVFSDKGDDVVSIVGFIAGLDFIDCFDVILIVFIVVMFGFDVID